MLEVSRWRKVAKTVLKQKMVPNVLTSPVVGALAVLRELTRVTQQFAVEISVPVAKVEDAVVVVDGKVTVGGGIIGIDRGRWET